MILRDRDTTANGVFDERRYLTQDFRGNVVVTLKDNATQVERISYTPYGQAIGMAAGDVDMDSDNDATDDTTIDNEGTWYALYHVNLDGNVDSTDSADTTSPKITLGRNVLTHANNNNRRGYNGYTNDGYIAELNHIRARAYDNQLGRWAQRDPAGYIDGFKMYGYVRNDPILLDDPTGLLAGSFLFPCPWDSDPEPVVPSLGPGLGQPGYNPGWPINVVPTRSNGNGACWPCLDWGMESLVGRPQPDDPFEGDPTPSGCGGKCSFNNFIDRYDDGVGTTWVRVCFLHDTSEGDESLCASNIESFQPTDSITWGDCSIGPGDFGAPPNWTTPAPKPGCPFWVIPGGGPNSGRGGGCVLLRTDASVSVDFTPNLECGCPDGNGGFPVFPLPAPWRETF